MIVAEGHPEDTDYWALAKSLRCRNGWIRQTGSYELVDDPDVIDRDIKYPLKYTYRFAPNAKCVAE